MMRILAVIGLISLSVSGLRANMAEPVDPGMLFSRPFTSEQVSVTEETILVTIDSQFRTAVFDITYHLFAEADGIRIPLLFYAMDLADDFSITIDDEPVRLLPIPYEYKVAEATPFEEFSGIFRRDDHDPDRYTVAIASGDYNRHFVELNDLRYFETDLMEGEHRVRVRYTASCWTDKGGWVRKYSFRYALSPALHWRSFGNLKVTVDASRFQGPVTTNLGIPGTANASMMELQLDRIPVDIMHITFAPGPGRLANLLIAVRPDRLAYTIGLLLMALHLGAIRQHRRKHQRWWASWVVWAGTLIVPLAFFVIWTGAYPLIDRLIGEHASRQHGYAQLVGIFYPLVVVPYFFIMWLTDRIIRRLEVRKKAGEMEHTPG